MNHPIRRAAQGERCTLRIADVCENSVRTVVLCHFRICAVAGMGQKPPDLFAAFGCQSCHDVLDSRRKPHLSREERYWYMLRGLHETHQRLLEREILVIQ